MASLEMIRSRLDFAALQTDARSRLDPVLVLRFRRNQLDRTRFGISTGRRTGTAVVRNTIRRRLRRVIVSMLERIAPGWDVLLIARPAAALASQADLATVFERLLHKAGLLLPGPAAR
jgi:ribonuclease P protein component